MKKKLEADLISIAHRILKLKNKSELIQLQQETQKLHEKLSVLLFVEENFGDIKPTIGKAEIVTKLDEIFEGEISNIEKKPKTYHSIIENESEENFADTFIETAKLNEDDTTEILLEETIEETVVNEVVTEDEIELTIVEEVKEEVKEEPLVQESPFFTPDFELTFDIKDEDTKVEEVVTSSPQIQFEDLLGPNYTDPVFVKPEEIENDLHRFESDSQIRKINFESRSTTLNDQVSKGIAIGLNDRIAFIKHLFGNNTEDYNRVLSQLLTFNSLEETQLFIEEMVKPDYNDWVGKDDYAQRFMEVIEKKFS